MIYFVDPETGDTYPVAETKAAIAAAEKLGFLPKTDQDFDAVDRVERREFDK